MSHAENRTDLIAALTALTDRLTAPGLTLGEANRLRVELAEVLGRATGIGRPDTIASGPIGFPFDLAACDGCLCAAG
jgi:hypothetical protein